MSSTSIGIVAGIGDPTKFDLAQAKFFSWDDEQKALDYKNSNKTGNTRLYSLVEIVNKA